MKTLALLCAAALLSVACEPADPPPVTEATPSGRPSPISFVREPVTVRMNKRVVDAAEEAGVDLRALMVSGLDEVEERLELPHTTVLVVYNPKGVIPETGEGGIAAPSTGRVTISLDPDHKRFVSALTRWVPLTIAHELHHSTRILNGPGYGETLMEAIVTEGLAQVFTEEVAPDAPATPWSRALNEQKVGRMWPQAREESSGGSYDHAAWFFGSQELPRWAGYSIGYRLIRSYLQDHPAETAASLVDSPARAILKGSRFCR
jgi:hypothetical protein